MEGVSLGVYEFNCKNKKCKELDKVIELIQGINEDHVAFCKACEQPMKRFYRSMNFKLKGSGFHINDYPK